MNKVRSTLLCIQQQPRFSGTFGTAAADSDIEGASCFPISSHPPGYEAVVKTINERGKGKVRSYGWRCPGGIFDITRRAARGTYDIMGCTEATSAT